MYVSLNLLSFSHLQNTWNCLPHYQLTHVPLLPSIFVLAFLSLRNLMLVLYSKCLFRLITSLHRFIIFCSWFCYLNTHFSILHCWTVMGFLLSLQCVRHVLSSSELVHPCVLCLGLLFLQYPLGALLFLQLLSFLLNETIPPLKWKSSASSFPVSFSSSIFAHVFTTCHIIHFIYVETYIP